MGKGLQFEIWKTELRENCAKEDKLLAFKSLDDTVLSLIFDRGIQPTPEAIIADGNNK